MVHIGGIALLLGNLGLLELRVFGRGAELPVPELARLSLGLAATGFGLAAASGPLMFSTQPGELLANRASVSLLGFTLKREHGEAVLRVEYLFVDGKTYALRSGPA